MRGRPREYENRYPLTASVEKDLWDFAQKYDILARDALSYGFQGLIETEIIKTKKASPDEIERYLEIKNREMQYIVSVRDKEQQTITEICHIRDEAKKNGSQSELLPESEKINWNKIPPDQKYIVYAQRIFGKEERSNFINRYIEADFDTRVDIADEFKDEFISRCRSDPEKPLGKLEANSVRKVLKNWAEAEEGIGCLPSK